LPVCETMLFGNQPFIADMTAYALTHDFDTAERMRAAYARRARLIADALDTASGLRVLPPKAGMFCLVDVSGTGLGSEDFAWSLLDRAEVAVMPGASFGDRAQDFIRLSLTVPDARIVEACRRIADFARTLTAAQPKAVHA
ncbi:MAG TPA: aminotransferase class I/II-fold pyridoxal phosphate-dependent enzyme, partial [Acidiphilium sp.]